MNLWNIPQHREEKTKRSEHATTWTLKLEDCDRICPLLSPNINSIAQYHLQQCFELVLVDVEMGNSYFLSNLQRMPEIYNIIS
jgi:hypothetical protein